MALPTPMSAVAAALTDTLAWSFSGLGSISVCAVFVAVFTIAPVASTDGDERQRGRRREIEISDRPRAGRRVVGSPATRSPTPG